MLIPKIPRLGAKSLIILRLLNEGEEKYGLELVEASDGALPRGGIYVFLGRLEESGLVDGRSEARSSGQGPPRRYYSITPLGRQILGAYEGLIRHMGKRR
jgi:PadR family transcriptional regulator